VISSCRFLSMLACDVAVRLSERRAKRSVACLAHAAESAGLELMKGKVTPAPDEQRPEGGHLTALPHTPTDE
jgi:hypothetical protein